MRRQTALSTTAPSHAVNTKNTDIPPGPAAFTSARAERANDAGMVYFGKKQYADALVQYAEATEMAPDKVAYHGNTAAAARWYYDTVTGSGQR